MLITEERPSTTTPTAMTASSKDTTNRQAWSKKEFEARLRAKGRAYHIHHPYNLMLNDGHATKAQIQGWVANRYYYQQAIPLKDGAVLSIILTLLSPVHGKNRYVHH